MKEERKIKNKNKTKQCLIPFVNKKKEKFKKK
jgi:hypothetical protein